MQVTETSAEGLKREYDLHIPAQDLSSKIDQKLEDSRANFAMKGFRKGKAPLSLMRQKFGASVTAEVVQEMVDGALKKLLEDNGHRPASQPKVDITTKDYESGKNLDFHVSYEILPEVPEVDFTTIELERMVVEVADSDIEETLKRLAETSTNYAEKTGAAEEKDQVEIDFLGKVDGEAFEGGAGQDYPLVLGSGQFIPGFEEQLIGKSAGDSVDVNVTFPEEYGAKDLAGKAAVFEVTVKAVKAPEASAIDDALAERFGAESLDILRERIKEQLENELKGASRTYLKRKLLDSLDSSVDFELPPGMVAMEADQIAHQLWHEDNPDVKEHEHPEIKATEEHTKIAMRRVRLGLLLAEVGRKVEVSISEEELNRAILQQASQYPGQEREFFEFVRKNQSMLQQIHAPLFEDKVIDHILEQAKISDKAVSKEELEAALEALEKEEI